MKKKILYLFNSVSRPTYRSNLHNILALPIGGKIQFRYTINNNVPPDFKVGSHNCEALIIFVDRFSKADYTYYPIRKATALKSYKIQNRLYIECRLSEYCGTDNQNLFTKKLLETVDKAPELKNGDPDNSNDGYYVQFADEVIDNLIVNSEQWFPTVKSISQTLAFKNDNTAFLKLSITSSEKVISQNLRGNEGLLHLKSGDRYSLHIFYYDPDQGSYNKNISISFNEPLEKYGTNRYSLGATTDNFSIDFSAKKTLISNRTFMEIIVTAEDTEKYRVNLPIQISSKSLLCGTLFYALIIMATIVAEKLGNFNSSSNSGFSLIFELIRWVVVIRLFIKFGSLSNLPIQ
jgi:hypothetical protein